MFVRSVQDSFPRGSKLFDFSYFTLPVLVPRTYYQYRYTIHMLCIVSTSTSASSVQFALYLYQVLTISIDVQIMLQVQFEIIYWWQSDVLKDSQANWKAIYDQVTIVLLSSLSTKISKQFLEKCLQMRNDLPVTGLVLKYSVFLNFQLCWLHYTVSFVGNKP